MAEVEEYLATHSVLGKPGDEDSLWFKAVQRTRDMYKLTMQEGEDVRFNDDPDETASWQETARQYVEIYERLLAPLRNARALERHRFFLFQHAIQEGNISIVEMLLDRGYVANLQGDFGGTPLLEAAGKGNLEMARLLLRYKASLEQPGLTETPLMRATVRDRPEMVRFLIENGAEVDGRVDGGETALFLVVREGNHRMFDLLVEFHANVNVQTRFGWTPLMEAAAHGLTGMVQKLLDAGADPDVSDALGTTALMLAAGEAHTEAVALLVSAGAAVNTRTVEGHTALMRAVLRPGNEAVIHLLLNAGADAEDAAVDGQTALSLAQASGQATYTGLLLSSGKKP